MNSLTFYKLLCDQTTYAEAIKLIRLRKSFLVLLTIEDFQPE